MLATCEVIGTAQRRPLSEAFGRDVLRGLSGRPKTLSSAYFYDDRGSRLFEEITRLDEYYLTRCERAILETYAGYLAEQLTGEPFRLVEIGAGDGHKTEILLRRFLAEGLAFEYVPIDICQRSVVDLVAKLRRSVSHEALRVRGIVGEYYDALAALPPADKTRNLVLFLGSSIGNFNHEESLRFLRGLRASLHPGDLALIGFDLKKNIEILQRAYDDSAGVTREFNFNLLDRINRELGGHFNRAQFVHRATYNMELGCMESWLVSCCEQRVAIEALRCSFDFGAWEGVRVERSFKYDATQIETLAAASGFQRVRHLFDERHRFVDSLWAAR
jgi:L-histidine N-alpha-methyltransferase